MEQKRNVLKDFIEKDRFDLKLYIAHLFDFYNTKKTSKERILQNETKQIS